MGTGLGQRNTTYSRGMKAFLVLGVFVVVESDMVVDVWMNALRDVVLKVIGFG